MALGHIGQSCEIILLRHAHSSANLKGILAGRDNTISLSERGVLEAQEVARALASYSFDAIFTSPLKRCLETVAPYLKSTGQKAVKSEALLEMEYGDWSGKSLAKLSKQKMWSIIQSRPSTVRFPSGESFLEMSTRANQGVMDMSKGKKRILIVSHGDVIKSIIAHHLGLPLDSFQRISVDPASLTTIKFPPSQVISMNSTTHLSGYKPDSKKKSRDRYGLGGGSGRK
jgi:probable phosphomutase (TIGR03848 family)